MRSPWSSLLNPKWVPPYDKREKHYPGMNYCGPGTNVWKRLRNKVQPVDALDRLCYLHDLDTEPRGPYRSRGDREKLRASDRRLIAGCRKLLRTNPNDPRLHLVISTIQLMLDHGARGR